MNRINEGKIHATEDIQIPKTNKQTKKNKSGVIDILDFETYYRLVLV